MKGDFSRRTFDVTKHYSSVRMQQGRVQLDADWNEQAEIAAHRVEIEALDVIGRSGGPIHDAGFKLLIDQALLSADEKKIPGNLPPIALPTGQLAITAGRYYIDGILCENERIVPYLKQGDLPDLPVPENDKHYLAYLDVWQRHLTALDDPHLREVALGGPDTATRVKTVWQVRLHPLLAGQEASCEVAFAALQSSLLGPNPLRAKAASDTSAPDPCKVPPSAGYLGLSNQLYRVEIHHDGDARDMDAVGAALNVTKIVDSVTITVSGGSWVKGQPVEIFTTASPKISVIVTLAQTSGTTLTLSGALPSFPTGAPIKIRPIDATYKWSRDNGSTATIIEKIEGDRLTVHDTGRDTVLGFAAGQWVEIGDDSFELDPRPNRLPQLFQIKSVDPIARTVTLVSAPAALAGGAKGVDATLNPKLRRWDGIGAVQYKTTESSPEGWIELELGVRIRFSASTPAKTTYRTFDYWLIPARSAIADGQSGRVEWPMDSNGPLALPPAGIVHHRAPLAMVHKKSTAAGGAFEIGHDCRHLFPPLTELTSFFYLGGDGQEAMPDLTKDPAVTNLVELPAKLQVGVSNGSWPVGGAKVEFKITRGAGELEVAGPPVAKSTGAVSTTTDLLTGIASCTFRLGPPTVAGDNRYQVVATLFDEANHPTHLPITFSANRSIASKVAFDPKDCQGLDGKKDVQSAIEAIAHDPVFMLAGGDGQSGQPGEVLPHALSVDVRSHCGPIDNRKVRFTASDKGALGSTSAEAKTSVTGEVMAAPNQGVASCWWRLDADGGALVQEVKAELLDADGATVLRTLRFTGNVAGGAGCREIVAMPGADLQRLFDGIRPGADAHVCFSPGVYELKETVLARGKGHLLITGAGPGSLLRGRDLEAVLAFVGCAGVTVRDLRVEAGQARMAAVKDKATPFVQRLNGALTFAGSGRVTVERADVEGGRGPARGASCITVQGATSVRIRACDLEVGDGQVGLLIVDASRAEIEDNTVRVAESPLGEPTKPFSRRILLHDRQYRERLARLLLSHVRVDAKRKHARRPVAPAVPAFSADILLRRRFPALMDDQELVVLRDSQVIREYDSFRVSGHVVTYECPAALAEGWQQIWAEDPGPESATRAEVKKWVRDRIDGLLAAEIAGELAVRERSLLRIPAFQRFFEALEKERRVVGSQGIVAGGSATTEIRILNNTVRDVAQGIHVGESHHREKNEERPRRDRAARVLITGNTVDVHVSAEDQRGRHGIFSGNSRSTVIENNVLRVERTTLAAALRVEGLRVVGSFGPMLMVRQNHLVDFDVGIQVTATHPHTIPTGGVWRVYDNVSEGATDPDEISPPMP